MAAAIASQKRSFATVQREDSYGQAPPAKKQMLASHQSLRTPPRQLSAQSSAEGRVFTRKSTTAQPTAFERKCVAVREKPAQQAVPKADAAAIQNQETIRVWQKHYRRTFPDYVFYFEGLSEDVRIKCTKQVTALGAVSDTTLIISCSTDYITARGEILLQ